MSGCLCGRDEWCSNCSSFEMCSKCDKKEAEIKRLHRVIAKELTENDELGCEYTYVNALRSVNKKLFDALDEYDKKFTAMMAVADRNKITLVPSGIDALREIARKAIDGVKP